MAISAISTTIPTALRASSLVWVAYVTECRLVLLSPGTSSVEARSSSRSWGVVSPTDKLENHQFSSEEIQAMVMVANTAHIYVTCHAYNPQSIRIAIDNGVRGIEHGNLIDRDTALLMAEKDCYLTPTLVTFFSMGDPAVAHFLPPDSRTKNVDVMNMGPDALRIAKECNVTMCYGSDLLGPLGKFQSQEFGLRSQVLSALDILQSATINPAKMMGQPQLG